MRIPWTRLALVAAVSFSAASATAAPTNFNPANTATRLIGLLSEDSVCTNTITPGAAPSAAPASCFVHASDAGAVYSDPSNDYYGSVSYVGASALTGGTNTFQMTVPATNWAKVLTVSFATSGATLTSSHGVLRIVLNLPCATLQSSGSRISRPGEAETEVGFHA